VDSNRSPRVDEMIDSARSNEKRRPKRIV
jgi:hypothetical protein